MSEPDADVRRWLGDLPFKLRRELAETIKQEADDLAAAIRNAAPRRSGALAGSVAVRRKRNDLDLEVTAGGDATTRYYDRSTDYSQRVIVDGRDNQGIARRAKGTGQGVSYDYSRAMEFGTENMPAQPFFYATYEARQEGIRQRIADKVADVVSRA